MLLSGAACYARVKLVARNAFSYDTPCNIHSGLNHRKPAMSRHKAFTLLELLVVIGIVAVLLGLLIPAVQKVRETAARIQGTNNLKQVGLAIHSYSSSNGDHLPISQSNYSAFFVILPYLDHGDYYAEVQAHKRPPSSNYRVRLYISPSDPTLRDLADQAGPASYAYNAQVFVDGVTKRPADTLINAYPDGTSNSIALTEHYAINCGSTDFLWFFARTPFTYINPVLNIQTTVHRSSFADLGDVVPDPITPPPQSPSKPDPESKIATRRCRRHHTQGDC